MAALIRLSTLAAFVSTVSGYAIAEHPTQTVGYGFPFKQIEPTEAPSMELVKRNLDKRALVNTCTEWTILGYGQPVCSNSETCLFNTNLIDGNLYEGCGETSIAYNWITECWNYPEVGTATLSETYCPSSAPSCGFYEFAFDNGDVYTNWGCSTEPYAFFASYLPTTNSSGGTQTSQTVTLAGGGTTSITAVAPVTETVTEANTATSTTDPVVISGEFGTDTATSTPTEIQPSFAGSSSQPTIGSHKKKKKTSVGGIVGGVIGGLAVIALLAFLVWFFLQKRRKDAEAKQPETQQVEGDLSSGAAYHSNNRISEIGGVTKPNPAYAGAFAPQQEYGSGNGKLAEQQVNEAPSPGAQSPLPLYAQAPQQTYAQSTPPAQFVQAPPISPPPPSNYTELDGGNNQPLQPGSHSSIGPVSPVWTYNSNATELGGSSVPNQQSPVLQQNAQAYQPPPNIPEMSGNAASPMPVRHNDGFDMNGAPLSENYGHHELP